MRRLATSAIDARQAARKYLSDKAIEAFVGDHHGGHVVPSAPPAEGPQRQPVRDLQRVGRELFEQGRDRPGQHRAIAAGERDQPGGQRDTHDPGRQLVPFGLRARHHQENLVSRGAVLRAEAIHRRPQAPRARAVEVRDLHNPHELNQNRHACAVNNATPTVGHEQRRERDRARRVSSRRTW